MLDVCGEPSKPSQAEGIAEAVGTQNRNHCCGRWHCLGPGLGLRALPALAHRPHPRRPSLAGHLGRQGHPRAVGNLPRNAISRGAPSRPGLHPGSRPGV